MKRTWILLVVCALLFSLAFSARAVDVEQGQEQIQSKRSPRIMPPIVPHPDAEPLRHLLAATVVGKPKTCGDFTIFPLLTKRSAQSAIHLLTMDEALSSGKLVITEQGSGNVPVLLATNKSDDHIFLMAGEMVLGGKQNRLIRQDVIVPPGVKNLEIPVYCGQQGRWQVTSGTFDTDNTIANAKSRKSVVSQKGQSKVWEDISENLSKNAVKSESSALQAAYDSKDVKERVDKIVRRCMPPSSKGVIGMAVVHRGRILGVDLFESSSLFARLADKILKSYAVEVYDEKILRDRSIGKREIEQFLTRLADTSYTPLPSPGAGQVFSFMAPPHEGTGMVLGSQPVHLAAIH